MTKVLGIVAAVLLAVATTGAQPTAVKLAGTTDTELIAHERALLEAVTKADKPAFLSLVGTDGVWTSKGGWIPMNMFVNGLGSYHVTQFEIVNPRVTPLSPDSAIVLYTWKGAGTFANQPMAPITLAATVWARVDGKWIAVHHQETDLTK